MKKTIEYLKKQAEYHSQKYCEEKLRWPDLPRRYHSEAYSHYKYCFEILTAILKPIEDFKIDSVLEEVPNE